MIRPKNGYIFHFVSVFIYVFIYLFLNILIFIVDFKILSFLFILGHFIVEWISLCTWTTGGPQISVTIQVWYQILKKYS